MPSKSNLDFYTSPPFLFSGFSKSFAESRYVVVGVPYDVTSSYRSGSRFGPAALREASLNIETYSIRSQVDLEDVPIADLGDMHIVSDSSEMVERIRLIVKDVVKAEKVPILLGGEHLITLGAVKAFPADIAIVDFDAHLDLRAAYMGEEYSHATFMRKVSQSIPASNIFHVGIRAVSKGEIEFSQEHGFAFMDINTLRNKGAGKACQELRSKLTQFQKVYLTFDMDVFDPAYAPAVGNPEADGLTPEEALTLITGICDPRIVGIDLVEISPHYDRGVTSALGARVIFEAISSIEKSRKTDSGTIQ